jgi:hypothetical protein
VTKKVVGASLCVFVSNFRVRQAGIVHDELLAATAPSEMRNAGQIYIPPGMVVLQAMHRCENLVD